MVTLRVTPVAGVSSIGTQTDPAGARDFAAGLGAPTRLNGGALAQDRKNRKSG